MKIQLKEEKFQFKDLPLYYKGTISLLNSHPSWATAIRKTILDGIEVEALDCSQAKIETNDKLLSSYIFDNIFVKVLEKQEGTYYINVQSSSLENSIPVTSNDIFINKEQASVEQGIYICHLAPKCFLKITNIKTSFGTGLDHSKYSIVNSPVSYKESDFSYIYILNERGFIEEDLKCVYKSSLPKNIDPNILIFSNKEHEKKLNEKDKRFFKKLTPIYNVIFTENNDYCQNFVISFKSCFSSKIVLKKCLEALEEAFKKAKNYQVIDLGDVLKIQYEGNLCTGQILFEKISEEYDCFKNSSLEKKMEISIKHSDGEKIFKKNIEDCLKILESLKKI